MRKLCRRLLHENLILQVHNSGTLLFVCLDSLYPPPPPPPISVPLQVGAWLVHKQVREPGLNPLLRVDCLPSLFKTCFKRRLDKGSGRGYSLHGHGTTVREPIPTWQRKAIAPKPLAQELLCKLPGILPAKKEVCRKRGHFHGIELRHCSNSVISGQDFSPECSC